MNNKNQQKNSVMIGYWKFSKSISPKELEIFAKRLVALDENYVCLYVRRVARDEWGLGFHYSISGKPSPSKQSNYIKKVSVAIKKRFGPHFLGWNIGSPAQLIYQ